MIHQTWFNMIKDVPTQFNTSHPQQLDLLGIGINRHKIYSTGKVIYTGLTRHAMADRDALGALDESASWSEAARTDQERRKEWVNVKILFPGCAGKSDEAQTKQISNLMNRMTRQIQGWDKDKVTGLMAEDMCSRDTGSRGKQFPG